MGVEHEGFLLLRLLLVESRQRLSCYKSSDQCRSWHQSWTGEALVTKVEHCFGTIQKERSDLFPVCSCILPIVPFSAILTQNHGGGVQSGGKGKQNKIKFCYLLSLQILKGNFLNVLSNCKHLKCSQLWEQWRPYKNCGNYKGSGKSEVKLPGGKISWKHQSTIHSVAIQIWLNRYSRTYPIYVTNF